MESNEKSSLLEVLKWSGCNKLPKKDDGESEWILAIARVCKVDGSISYCIIENGYMEETRVIKDFGKSAAIKKYVSVYPYVFLKKEYVNKFTRNNTREAKIDYIKQLGFYKKTLSELSDAQIEKLLIKAAKYKQINNQEV
jgi:hypothetical protein